MPATTAHLVAPYESKTKAEEWMSYWATQVRRLGLPGEVFVQRVPGTRWFGVFAVPAPPRH